MNKIKICTSIALSLLINFAIFYTLVKKEQVWKLSQSSLKTGANTSGIKENMQIASINIVTTPAQIQLEVAAPVTKPRPAPIIRPPVKPTKVEDNKLVTPAVIEKKSLAKPITSLASGEASPKISQKARLQSSPPPIVYPPGAIEQNAIGKVSLKAFIDIDGKISKVEVIASSGYKVLDEAAIEWFHELKFYPAKEDNVQVGSFVSQTISFSLNNIDRDNV